jgi:uncharacterized membrane protein
VEQVAKSSRRKYRAMANIRNNKANQNQPQVYQIRLKDGDTLLTGPVVDQAALHGLLKKVRDLGMPLVSIVQVQLDKTYPSCSIKEKK